MDPYFQWTALIFQKHLWTTPYPVDFAAPWEWCGRASAPPAGHKNRSKRSERWNRPGKAGDTPCRLWAIRMRENHRRADLTQGRRANLRRKLRKTQPNPSGGKHKPNQKTIPKRCNAKRGRRQSWKRSAGKNRSKKRERNAPGTRAERFVEDWHRTLRKPGRIPGN